MTQQLGATAAIVAFAAGTVASAGTDGLGEALRSNSASQLEVVAPVDAADHSIEVVSVTDEVALPHGSREQSDPSAFAGQKRVITEGEPGSATVTYDVTYVNGIEVSRTEGITIVTEEPQDRVVAVGTLSVPSTTDSGANRAIGKQLAADLYGWSGTEWECLNALWTRESNWRHNAHNKSSGAHGIPQALPGSKMASAGSDWLTNPATQIKWGLGYVKNRYGTPCGAWSHFTQKNWY